MTDELERPLREALRAVPPREGFSERTLARLPVRMAERRHQRVRLWWVSGSLAASLILAVTVHHIEERDKEREGLRAREELLEALRVTSEKLDLAYQAVHASTGTEPSENST